MELIIKGNNTVGLAIGGLFENVDFTGMTPLIEKIGDTSKDLTDGEKQLASQLVDQYEEDVLGSLAEKSKEMTHFITFLNPNERRTHYYHNYESHDNYMHDMYGHTLADKTNTMGSYQAYLDKKDELAEYRDTRKPEKPILGADASVKETIKHEKDYEYELSVYEIEELRLERHMYKLERDWKKEMLKNEEVQELLLGAKKFAKQVTKLEKDLKSKTRLAKLSVAISSKDAREALAELMKFKIAL